MAMKRAAVIGMALVLGIVLGGFGCTTEDPVFGETLRSPKARVASDASDGEMEALAAGNGAFGFDLYHWLASGDDGNLFCSPLSISTALAMTWAGARGETEAAMAGVLHFDLGQDRLHPAFNRLGAVLDALGAGSDAFRLHVVNALWGQTGYEFREAFLDLMAEQYGAGMSLLDFAADPEAARLVVNDWAAYHTENRIRDLVPPGGIHGLTRLVLANAIYFKADWADPFEPEGTHDRMFRLAGGEEVRVPTMWHAADFRYADGDGWQAVELPYEGREVSMLVVVPDAGRFAEVEASFGYAALSDVLAALAPRRVALAMPKFEFTRDFALKAALEALGMGIAFDPDLADFSGMEPLDELYIGNVFHKAFVAVDEEGTEAAAATAVVMDGGTSVPPEALPFDVDRPFLFLIREHATGAVLFLGRVIDPRS